MKHNGIWCTNFCDCYLCIGTMAWEGISLYIGISLHIVAKEKEKKLSFFYCLCGVVLLRMSE